MEKIFNRFYVKEETSYLEINDEDRIKEFIREKELKDYLISLHSKIKKYFGDRKQYLSISSSMYSSNKIDYDIDDRILWINVEIYEDMDFAEAIKKRNKLDEEYIEADMNTDVLINYV